MRPTDDRKQLGASGERIARKHLESLGYRILEANFRCPEGEMDLIAEESTEHGVVLVFLEVKTRRSRAYGTPLEAVDSRKQKRLTAVAEVYLGRRACGGQEPDCRFDVAEVTIGSDGLARVALRQAIFGAS